MKTISCRYKPGRCPYCNTMNDEATRITMPHIEDDIKKENDNPPEPGSINLCMYCGNPAVYDDDLKLRRMARSEVKEIKKTDPDVAYHIKMGQKAISMTMIRHYLNKK